jgi:hypothetical protein
MKFREVWMNEDVHKLYQFNEKEAENLINKLFP